MDTEGLISTDTIAVFDGDTIGLTPNLFDNDALIFKNIKGKQAILAHKTKGPVLAMNYADFSDLGIWAKPNAPYICIEPWLGYADLSTTNKQLQDKEGARKLATKATHSYAYKIVVY